MRDTRTPHAHAHAHAPLLLTSYDTLSVSLSGDDASAHVTPGLPVYVFGSASVTAFTAAATSDSTVPGVSASTWTLIESDLRVA